MTLQTGNTDTGPPSGKRRRRRVREREEDDAAPDVAEDPAKKMRRQEEPTDSTAPQAESSRVRVVGLPRSVNSKRLKTVFGACGEVTDCAIILNKSNGRPRMAFVGYKTPECANEAVKRLNQSYLDTIKMTVEIARPFGDKSIEKTAWSRHTKKRVEKEELTKKEEEERQMQETKKAEEAVKAKKDSEKKKKDAQTEQLVQSFLKITKSQATRPIWENDIEVDVDGDAPREDQADEDEEGGDTGDAMELDSEEEAERQERLGQMSDLDFLRSKQKQPAEATNEAEGDEEKKKPKKAKKEKEGGHGHSTCVEVPEPKAQEDDTPPEESILETGRLYLRNLPFSTTEDEVKEYCSKFGLVVEAHVPLTRDSKQSKGVAFVQYAITEHAVKAYKALNKAIFQGRVLEVEPGKPNPYEHEEGQGKGDKSSYKKKKAAMDKADAGNVKRWNTVFMKGDAVADALADRLKVDKERLVGKDTKDVAARLAMGEAHLTTEVKEIFEDEGLDLQLLTSDNRTKKRSDRIILVKNLGKDTKVDDLTKLFESFGAVEKVVAPKNLTIALIQFVTAQEAKVAFRKLAYRPFNHVPLFLEWAPVGSIRSNDAIAAAKEETSKQEVPEKVAAGEEDNIFDDDARTLYVTNIAFSIGQNDLESFVKSVAGGDVKHIRSIKLSTKGGKSRGFAFIQMANSAAAKRVKNAMAGKQLMQRDLNVEFAQTDKRADAGEEDAVECPEGCDPLKLTVKNVPFEATRQDIVKIFSGFSQVKSVRLPKKAKGAAGSGGAKSPHRGFAFVEFTTPKEAQNAIKKLSSTHLYGRHLVLEYSKADSAGIGARTSDD